MENDMNSLSHSKWRCKYHIVFAPKYRRYERIKFHGIFDTLIDDI